MRGPASGGRTERRWLLAALAYAVVLLTALLIPFDTYEMNDAAWSIDGGLEFHGSGIARSAAPPTRLHRRLVASGALTIEIVAETAGVAQGGPARIVAYSERISQRNFLLAQHGADLRVRLRTPRSGTNVARPILGVEAVFDRPGPRHIVVTYDGIDQHVYVDGALRKSNRGARGSFANWDPDHLLVFGNEATGGRPWRGRLALVAIYDRALRAEEVETNHASATGADTARVQDGLIALYRFSPRPGYVPDESGLSPPLDLEIPRVVQPWRPYLDADREYLQGEFVAAEAREIALNLAIFFPLGLLVARAALAARAGLAAAAALTIAVGVLLSLGAETAQYFLVSRYSELGDVLLNGIGTLLGLLLALVLPRRRSA